MTDWTPSYHAAKSLHQRPDSRSSNSAMQYKYHTQRTPNLTGSSMSEMPTSTIPGVGPGGSGDWHSNATGNDGIVKEGLGSLNRWSQSTTSSRGLPNHYMGHGRGGSSVSGHDMYNDLGSPTHVTGLETNTLSAIHTNLQGGHSPQRPRTSEPAGSSTLDPIESPTSPALPPNDVDTNAFDGSDSHMVQLSDRNMNESEPTVDDDWPSFSDTMNGQPKRRRSHSQKGMLSRALQKANTAVLLDNAANLEGAMGAYSDACQLLQLVMLRSNGGTGEKLKLQEIRDTYMIRVNELQGMELSYPEPETKALPERPVSDQSYDDQFQPLEGEGRPFSRGSMGPGFHLDQTVHEEPRAVAREQIPPRRQSLLPSPLDDELRFMTIPPKPKGLSDHDRNEYLQANAYAEDAFLRPSHLPAGRRSPEISGGEANAPFGSQPTSSLLNASVRDNNESTSWLDTIDESGASSPSSAHSQTSSLYLRCRKSSHDSCGTESEFDAALDAAVEAAYDEGLEPAGELGGDSSDDDIVANARRNVELAKQRVREAEREAAAAMGRGREIRHTPEQEAIEHSNQAPEYPDEESEEEERLLEEMTRGYVMDDFEFGLQSKSALPQQSDSSGASGTTWENPAASNQEAAGVALSTLVEDDVLSSTDTKIVPEASTAAAPSNVPVPPRPPSGLDPKTGSGVRARRFSGQNPKELKIETSSREATDSDPSGPASPFDSPPPPVPKDEPQESYKSMAALSASRPDVDGRDPSGGSFSEDYFSNTNLGRAPTQEDEHIYANMPSTARPMGKMPSAPDNLGKRNPSLSAMRGRNGSVPIPGGAADSPNTPSTSAFPTLDTQKAAATGAFPGIPPSASTTFTPDGLPSDGMHLFDSHIHSPASPGTPNPGAPNPPASLEPCPESFLLRPFWLMRCIYESISHPCGGYLSTKLFVPRDIWRVKNVKLKAVEEKVSNCDLLTAALLKLAQVDKFDADAVLEEMQSLESVLDQVQASLSKKLGNDVGVQGAVPLFKPFPVSDDGTASGDPLPSKASSGPGKSYLSSWRKLRSKNSGVGTAASTTSSKETSKDNLTISSIPMSSLPSPPSVNRNVMQLQVSGPNSHYMAALARLCDAAQVIDQIAQQVEDPGLRHSSPTLVGLELSTRHAAEFFGFYVCRFILIDIATMLDKFVKRGSEWVLA